MEILKRSICCVVCLLILTTGKSAMAPSEPKEEKPTTQPVALSTLLPVIKYTPEPTPTPTPEATPVPTPKVLKVVATATPKPVAKKVSTKSSGTRKLMEVTGYTAGYESTGKQPGHPEYGITASTKKAVRGVTVAAGPSVPFGTKVYIPYFKDWDNNGIFVVQDRGGAIHDDNIDVFFGYSSKQLREAQKFGRKYSMEVYILN